jgi:hypothetical protein
VAVPPWAGRRCSSVLGQRGDEPQPPERVAKFGGVRAQCTALDAITVRVAAAPRVMATTTCPSTRAIYRTRDVVNGHGDDAQPS